MAIKKTAQNGLKVDSMLKLNKIITLDKGLILGKIGNLDKNILNEVDKKFLKMLGI